MVGGELPGRILKRQLFFVWGKIHQQHPESIQQYENHDSILTKRRK
jgi:hypothetical protein